MVSSTASSSPVLEAATHEGERLGSKPEGKRSSFCQMFLLPLYGRAGKRQGFVQKLVFKFENGPVYSRTIRDIFRRYHGVDVGLYTIGPCNLRPGNLVAGTRVGRYCSIYYTVRTLGFDGPLSKGGASLFCATALNPDASPTRVGNELTIGHDVFIGHNAIILPSVKEIGHGAVIGAGSVVHNDIPPYAIVTGNPARVVRYRFSEPKIQELLASQWWLKSIDELSLEIAAFQTPLEGNEIR